MIHAYIIHEYENIRLLQNNFQYDQGNSIFPKVFTFHFVYGCNAGCPRKNATDLVGASGKNLDSIYSQ